MGGVAGPEGLALAIFGMFVASSAAYAEEQLMR